MIKQNKQKIVIKTLKLKLNTKRLNMNLYKKN